MKIILWKHKRFLHVETFKLYIILFNLNVMVTLMRSILLSLWLGAPPVETFKFYDYPKAVKNRHLVAEEIFNLLKFITENHEIDPKNIHLIGHSLGAHISGEAAFYFQKTGEKIGRITGPSTDVHGDRVGGGSRGSRGIRTRAARRSSVPLRSIQIPPSRLSKYFNWNYVFKRS